ncbi:hypothetical protein CK503_14820 [Aliifodinibius salipaludis]|uniref:Uncharacterized protein n=1 Tax=Fodinibius salipaludis TaxID=2032627 RepID=A0A2A2G7B8_9BACT|nr:hypothetical protein CK503_14820 [Aliifodinibius salipaludis]
MKMEKGNTKKLKMHSLLSILTIVLGTVLLIFMIVVEGEPGAIPLMLLVVGIVWYFITRYKLHLQHR